MDWPWPSRDIILAGEFNSVQSPHLDLFGGTRTGHPESVQLGLLLTTLRLEDARILSVSADDDDPPEPTDFFTHWTKSTASRIDRFYVPLQWTASVQWVEVTEPAVASDHQRVSLILAQGALNDSTNRSVCPIQYPISSSIRSGSSRCYCRNLSIEMWGEPHLRVQGMIRFSVVLLQSQRCASVRNNKANDMRLRFRGRCGRVSRVDSSSFTPIKLLSEECLIQEGRRLERTIDCLRWDFKRVSD